MPKPILFDNPSPRRKRKRKKRKIDYTELIKPPVIPNIQCPHTKRAQDASSCSQCMLVQPSVVHKPVTKSWWDEDEDIEISLEDAGIDLDDTLDLTPGDD